MGFRRAGSVAIAVVAAGLAPVAVACSGDENHPAQDGIVDAGGGGTAGSATHHPDAEAVGGGAGNTVEADSGPPDAVIEPAPPTTALVSAYPPAGATDVPRTTWIILEFDDGLDPDAARGVTLDCGPSTPEYDVDLFGSATLVLNPRAPLDPSAACTVAFFGPDGATEVEFTVAAAGSPAIVPYDRNDTTRLDPFPDEFYLLLDAATRTGFRVDVPLPTVDTSLQALLGAAIAPSATLDGMSPLAPIVVQLPDAVDAATVPHFAADSLDPFATIGLFDIDPGSGAQGQRVPFDALYRDEANTDGSIDHVLIAFPSVPLRPRGRYAFAVTNRALVEASRPLEASAFFQTVAAGQGTTPAETRLSPSLAGVLTELAATSPPLRVDDLALALGVRVRSIEDIPSDLQKVREWVVGNAPPAFTITEAVADTTPGTHVAAIVTGTWSPPDWSADEFVNRNATGEPEPVGTASIAFTLAIPSSALTSPAPIVMYQHGQPGNAEDEVPRNARRGLAEAGFAVIGFTDVANRDIIPTGDVVQLNVQALTTLLQRQDLPDYLSLLSHADQLSLLRMIPTMTTVDVLPLGAPDGVPELDPALPVNYLGISQGAVHGIGLMAFAPEIRAAALTAGAGRFIATLIHQASDPLYQGIAAFFPTLDRAHLYSGMALVQMAFDRQDPQNLARFVYTEPLDLAVNTRPSILLTEGLGDPLVPFYATRAGAAQLGLAHLAPQAEATQFLPSIAAPVQGNVDSATSAAFFQYVPEGYALATPTPGCVANAEPNGHFCAQTAAEAIRQRVDFFTTALDGTPVIIDPFQ